MWTRGQIYYHGQIVDYIAKVSDQPSEVGIDLGCVFKLEVDVAEKTIISYDRGWDIYPESDEQEAILELILKALKV
ncbi:DUF7678 domain-containing protein [Streptococcus mitis]|uniref:DUF7678 domain-containing protein n=1 Tax=Streptococcus mitis SK1073 TaxID=1008452 RepID=F9HEB4_STRMT|nr:hypothetical protein [Streptococcus mitis]EGP65050.1 hypothetical protein HMPREF9958_0069 [Streptococcus mitis SK1073]